MATWNANAIIGLLFIPCYALLFCFNVYNCKLHGIRKEAGYVCLVAVSVLKIIGGILTTVYWTGVSDSLDVATWGANLQQLGYYPLSIATLAFIRKWLRTWDGITPGLDRYLKPVRYINVLLLAGFICTIIGGAWSNPTSSHVDTGFSLRRAGNIIFLITNVIILLITIFMFRHSVVREQSHDPLLLQLFIVLPIMLIRIIYTVVQAFLSTPDNPGHNTWVYLGLLLIPDLLSTAIFTLWGVAQLRPSRRAELEERGRGQVTTGDMSMQQMGNGEMKDEQASAQTQPHDYRYDMRRGPLRRLSDRFLG